MLTHLVILFIILLVLGGGARLVRASRGLGEGVRNLKKGIKGESDIDVTHTIKRIRDEEDRS